MNIVFMGTPEFAVFQLKALIKRGHNISGVFCNPDKPTGRHMVITPPPVKIVAEENKIPIFQPQSLKNAAAYNTIKELAPDVIVVAAYGKLLPKNILEFPPHGAINVHGSLLPRLRGAAPIQRAIIEGEKETGITVMQMAEGMDTGDMLLQRAIDIGENETAEELFTRLAVLGGTTLVEALEKLNELTPIQQDSKMATWASPLSIADGELDFHDSAINNYRRFLGCYPWPGAYFLQDGKKVKVLEMKPDKKSGAAGEILDKKFEVACGEGSLIIQRVVPQGKKEMDGASFLNGQRLKKGNII